MIQFKEQEYTVNICTDIMEWGKEFYGIPEGAELENRSELESNCMGFSQIDDKEIWVFVPKNFNDDELAETLAHEVGHIIVPQFTTNPDQIEENDQLHEEKAEYYEKYYMTVRRILNKAKIVLDIDELEVYYEKTFDNKHCYKYQIPGQKIIIVADVDKDTAWSNFLIEYGRCKESDLLSLIEKLIEEYKKEELPHSNEPYHHEAEVTAGFNFFIEWLKKV